MTTDTLTFYFDHVAFWTGWGCIFLNWFDRKFHDLANQIEELIDQSQERFHALGNKYTDNHMWDLLLTTAIVLSFPILALPIMNASDVIPEITIPWYVWITIVSIYIPVLLILAFYFLAWLIELLNEKNDGYALGGIGWIMLAVGAFCDTADKLIEFVQWISI